jgi:hypothetical protein
LATIKCKKSLIKANHGAYCISGTPCQQHFRPIPFKAALILLTRPHFVFSLLIIACCILPVKKIIKDEHGLKKRGIPEHTGRKALEKLALMIKKPK